MRERTRRGLGTVLAVMTEVIVVTSYNSWSRRSQLAAAAEAGREQVISSTYPQMAAMFLSWESLLATTGDMKSGPRYSEALEALDGTEVALIGFGFPVPYVIDAEGAGHAEASAFPLAGILSAALGQRGPTHRSVSDFVMLPVPSECYIRSAPPWNEAVYVHLAQGKEIDVRDGAVQVVRGRLRLSRESGVRFFYAIDEATSLSEK